MFSICVCKEKNIFVSCYDVRNNSIYDITRITQIFNGAH